MKDTMIVVLATVLFIAVLWVVSALGCYERNDCEVIGVDGTEVTVEDSLGFVWKFEGEGYTVGDIVTLVMSPNGTDNTFSDDKVIKVK
jgi:hypothetical protein